MNYDYSDDDLDMDGGQDERPYPTLMQTLEALVQGATTGLTATVYYGLSDLDSSQLAVFENTWERLDTEYRVRLIQELVDTSETNFELDYRTVGFFALDDDDAAVRAAAVELLWTDETQEGMRKLLDMAFEDDSDTVRAQAAGALGKYILLGEFDDLPETQTAACVDACFTIFHDEDEDVEVRRRALESLGSSSRDGVNDTIREAYFSNEPIFKIGALFAMGKTYDEEWSGIVQHELNSPDAEVRYEAARAAGEIGIEDAVPKLSRMVHELDRDIQEVSIWALGEIGGKEAARVLQRLLDDPAYAVDEGLIEALEDALVSSTLPGDELALWEMGEDDDLTDGLTDPRGKSSRWN
jgi:HEAT repeat protein